MIFLNTSRLAVTAVSPLEDPDVDAKEAKVVLISANSPRDLLSPIANFDCSLDCSQRVLRALDQGRSCTRDKPITDSLRYAHKAAEDTVDAMQYEKRVMSHPASNM